MGGFEVAKETEVEKIGESGAEESGVGHARPGLPRDGAPSLQQVDGGGLLDGDGKNDKSAEDEIPSGYGECVVFRGDAFAKDDVHGEP